MVKINSGGTVISNLNLTHAAGATRNIFLPIAGFTASDMLLDGGSGALAVTDLAETAAISLTNIDISNAITAIGTNITTEYLTKSLDFTLNNVTMNITNHCYIYNNKAIIQSNSFLMQNSTCFSSSANAFNISMTGTNASIPMDITLNNSSILNAGADGIAMVLEDAPVNLIIDNSTITNSSSRGMDISLRDNVTFSAIIRNNSTISNAALELVRIDNDTVSSGGSVTVDIDDSSFINAGASGIFLNDLSATGGATITIDNTIVTDTNNYGIITVFEGTLSEDVTIDADIDFNNITLTDVGKSTSSSNGILVFSRTSGDLTTDANNITFVATGGNTYPNGAGFSFEDRGTGNTKLRLQNSTILGFNFPVSLANRNGANDGKRVDVSILNNSITNTHPTLNINEIIMIRSGDRNTCMDISGNTTPTDDATGDYRLSNTHASDGLRTTTTEAAIEASNSEGGTPVDVFAQTGGTNLPAHVIYNSCTVLLP